MKHISNKEKVKAQKQHINYLKQKVSELRKYNYDLNSINYNLTEENKKLIEWVEKILNNFGTNDVDKIYMHKTLTIPVIKRQYNRDSIFNNQVIQTEEIIIPEIRLMKSKMI